MRFVSHQTLIPFKSYGKDSYFIKQWWKVLFSLLATILILFHALSYLFCTLYLQSTRLQCIQKSMAFVIKTLMEVIVHP